MRFGLSPTRQFPMRLGQVLLSLAPTRQVTAAVRRKAAARRRYGRFRGLLTREPPDSLHTYLSSTLAPAFSSVALIFSASSLVTPSLTALGAASTRSLASLRPRPVSARTSLITSIFFSPNEARTTVNSVFSS